MSNKLAYCDTSKLRHRLYNKTAVLSTKSISMLVEEANRIMDESRLEVPVQSGTLQSIADVVVTRRSELKVAIKIGYGCNGDAYNEKSKMWASRYAVLVHEDMTLNHPNGGKAKFFEDPLRRGRQRIHDAMQVLLKEVGK